MLPLFVAMAMVVAGELIYYSVSTFTYTLYSRAAAKSASKSATWASTSSESSKPTTQKCGVTVLFTFIVTGNTCP